MQPSCKLTWSCRSRITKRDAPTGGINWGTEKIRGVNLGGWLVLEPWITPSIFQQYDGSKGIIDEYTLGQVLGNQTAHDNVLKPHWDSWVQLADFQKIADSGFNVVRIPIGFWAYDNSNSPYASGAAPYMDTAIGWARQVGVKVIIDLHGAPGSQVRNLRIISIRTILTPTRTASTTPASDCRRLLGRNGRLAVTSRVHSTS